MPRISRQRKPLNGMQTPRCGLHDDMVSLNTSSEQRVSGCVRHWVGWTDFYAAERHGSEPSKRQRPKSLVNYGASSSLAPSCPATPRLTPQTSARPILNDTQDPQGQRSNSVRSVQILPIATSSSILGAVSPNASSPSGSYFSTVLSQSPSSNETEIDSSAPTRLRTGGEQANPDAKVHAPTGSMSIKRKGKTRA